MTSRPGVIAFILLFSAPTAFAYIDPGSGMLIWQGLIAAIGAVLMFVRSPWESVKKLFERFKKRK